MPRGRHRHAPPLHRLLAPSAIAAAALACAGGGWLASDTGVVRGFGLGAAAAAVASAVLLRHWDRIAGLRIAEARAAKANLEWRAEERQAELEADLEETRELRGKLEDKLRERRAELDRLRGEHAALLRRYATAETERASALEGRRQLAIAGAEPAKELMTGAADHRKASGAPSPLTYLQANEALKNLKRNAVRQQEQEQEQGPEPEQGPEQEQERAEKAEQADEAARVGEKDEESTACFDFFGAGVSEEEAEAEAEADEGEPEIPRQPVRRPSNTAGKVIDLAEPA